VFLESIPRQRLGVFFMVVPVCPAPCRQMLPRDTRHFIEGPGVPSAGFLLPKHKQQLTLDVQPASNVQSGIAVDRRPSN
jgi:hypothetical protein